jgi:hypothetical protein
MSSPRAMMIVCGSLRLPKTVDRLVAATGRASVPRKLRYGRLHIVRVNKALSRAGYASGTGTKAKNEALVPRSAGTRASTRTTRKKQDWNAAYRKSHSRMMMGIGIPSIHKSTPRNMLFSHGDFRGKNVAVAKLFHVAECQSFFAAASTASAWPGTRTFRQTAAILPARSMRKVERTTPIYLRPNMVFSAQTP